VTQTSGFKLTIIDNQNLSPATDYELIKSEIVVGRDQENSDLAVAYSAVSRRHARLIREGDVYFVEDLGSSNGTFLNGQTLNGRHPLKSGDRIQLGQAVTLIYQAPLAESAATALHAAPVMSAGLQTMIGEEPMLPLVNQAPPRLTVTIAGEKTNTYSLTAQTLTIGRAEGNDIVIPSQVVSRQHAQLQKVDGGYKLSLAPEAKNAFLLEGRPLDGPRVLRHGDTLRIDSTDPGMLVTLTYDAPSQEAAKVERDIVFGEKTLVQIGRDSTNDVVLPSPNVSRFHAQVERVGQRYRVEDLRSSNGTFVNGERIEGPVWLKPNDTIRIGQFRFVMGKDQLAKYDDSKGLRVDVVGLNKWVRKDLNILQNISVALQPREFIVVVGQSGGGKSTFVDAVAGYRPATPPSKVYVNDVDIYAHFDAIRNEIGFVPQKDIIHMELTVYQALDYAAQLRMPTDTSKEERHKRVMEVLQDLDLVHRQDVQISGLSGGQQKRVSIGVELLTKPGLFFLDEPTSGLDPGTETALMQLMRRLADQGRTIILITHATKNVMLADKVIFLARGGFLAWFGPPDEALEYFDKYRSERERRAARIEFDEIYAILDNPNHGKAEDWARRYRDSPAYQNYVAKPLAGKLTQGNIPTVPQPEKVVRKTTGAGSQRTSGFKQFFILSARNVKILTRDRFALILMLVTAPIVSLLDVILAILLGRDPFSFQNGSMANVMITLFLMTIYGVMVGGISQMREIVKEQDIYKRERLVNLQILPYVLSKIWVAAILALYQALAYTVVHYLAFDMPGGVLEFLQVYITMTLATLAGMMLGLFASALAPNANSAPLLVIMLMLPQIVLAGALVPLPGFVSAPTSTRWAFEALMSITGSGSDVAADICWALPEDVRAAMSVEDKLKNGCRCMGLNMLKEESCNYPGLGEFYNPAIAQPPPPEPAALPPPPPEPAVPERPLQPLDQSDNIAMADFFVKLQDWEAQASRIQEEYKKQIEAYQAQSEVYKSQVITYQQDLINWQIAQASAVTPAESTVNVFYTGIGWSFVDKENPAAYLAKIIHTWLVQLGIITILFVVILFLQKRKDAT